MIAVLGGLGAASMWAAAVLLSSRSSRLLGVGSALAWVMLVGLVITAPAAAVAGIPRGLDAGSIGWLAVVGVGNVGGLLFEYAALRIGKVGIVAAIASTEGAIAAILSVFYGEPITWGVGATLGVITVGIVLASLSLTEGGAPPDQHRGRAAGLAMGAALFFGVGLFAAGHASSELPIAWVLLPARLLGVAGLVVPLALTSRLKLTRRALPLVVAGGLCEVFGLLSFAYGARQSTAVSAVLGSQFAAIAALGGFVLLKERLRSIQVVGVATIVVGVSALAALRG